MIKKLLFLFTIFNISIHCSEYETKEILEEGQKVEAISDSLKTEHLLKKLLANPTLYTKVLKGGMPEELQEHVLSFIVKPYQVLKKVIKNYGAHSICVLSDGNLATNDFRSIKVFNIATGECVRTIENESYYSAPICALSNCRIAAGCSKDKTIKIWDAKTGECVKVLANEDNGIGNIVAHLTSVLAFCVLPNGNLASGSNDGAIKIWDIESGECLQTIDDDNWIVSLCALKNGCIAIGARNGVIKIYNLATRELQHCLIHGSFGGLFNDGDIKALGVLPDGNLVSASFYGTVKVWDINSGKCIKTLSHKNYHNIVALCVLSDSNILTASFYGKVKFWDLKKEKSIKTVDAHNEICTAMCLLPDNNLVTSSRFDGEIKIWGKGFETSGVDVEETGTIEKLKKLITNKPFYCAFAIGIVGYVVNKLK